VSLLNGKATGCSSRAKQKTTTKELLVSLSDEADLHDVWCGTRAYLSHRHTLIKLADRSGKQLVTQVDVTTINPHIHKHTRDGGSVRWAREPVPCKCIFVHTSLPLPSARWHAHTQKNTRLCLSPFPPCLLLPATLLRLHSLPLLLLWWLLYVWCTQRALLPCEFIILVCTDCVRARLSKERRRLNVVHAGVLCF
jgi:hypothetical protein